MLWIFVVKGIPSKIRSVSKNNKIAFKKANFWIFCSMFSLRLAEYMVDPLFVGKNAQTEIDGLFFGFPDDIVAQKTSAANG